MNIIEKLGIPPGHYETMSRDGSFHDVPPGVTTSVSVGGHDHFQSSAIFRESDEIKRIKDTAPEMLEALIEIGLSLEDSPGGWGYYNETIQDVIKKATGLEWEKIKELLK